MVFLQSFEFLMNQIFGQRFIILGKWRLGVNYCWNYWPSKLFLHFIELRVDQLNKKHTKTAVNSAIQLFESRYQRKYLVKVGSFSAHPPQNFKLNGNHALMANISNLTNVRDLVHWKCIIWAKSDLPIINSVCESLVYR